MVPAGYPNFLPGFILYRESICTFRAQRIAIVSAILSCIRSSLLPFGYRCPQRQASFQKHRSILEIIPRFRRRQFLCSNNTNQTHSISPSPWREPIYDSGGTYFGHMLHGYPAFQLCICFGLSLGKTLTPLPDCFSWSKQLLVQENYYDKSLADNDYFLLFVSI
ncbi:hypothetical protein BDR03DRAFT_684053 [Suillus americanus]|nr:hypothetical protein BDR03DRAFT_684053 [Suillus americanus]